MPKANFSDCILEMKAEADNEPAISLRVHFKSGKKWKYFLRKKKTKQTKGPKKIFYKKFLTTRVEPRTSNV